MSQTTILHLTGAEIAAEEYRRDDHRDRAERPDRPLTTAELLRSLRKPRMTEAELLRRATDAAHLSMVGEMYSAEDRRDCAAEIVFHVLASIPGGGMPFADDRRADLSTMRGMAQNFRRSTDRRNARNARVAAEHAAQRAATWQDAEHAAEDWAQRLTESREDAADAATAAVRRLGLPAGAAVWRVLYYAVRQADNATAAQCADELGIAPGSMDASISAGRVAIRLMFPDFSTLIRELTGADSTLGADGVIRFTLADERFTEWRNREAPSMAREWREGTANGERPEPPADAEQARAVCRTTWTYRRPLTRKLLRRRAWTVSAIGYVPLVGRDGRTILSRPRVQAVLDARRALRRPMRQTRERSVTYNAAQYGA